MKRIIVNLLFAKEFECNTIIEALRFLPERENIEFIFITNGEEPFALAYFKECPDCNYKFIYEWHQEDRNALDLHKKYNANGVFIYDSPLSDSSQAGFSQIQNPKIDVFYLAKKTKSSYSIDEDTIIDSINLLIEYLNKNKLQNLSFLRSQIAHYEKQENAIIELLKQNFELTELLPEGIQSINTVEKNTIVTLFPMLIQGIVELFQPATTAIFNHRLNVPTVDVSKFHEYKPSISQKIRYCMIQLYNQICNTQSDTNTYSYKSFAGMYDRYMAHVTYQKWVDFLIHRYIAQFDRMPKSIAEIACGTANISNLFAKQNYHVIAFDKSPEMLDIARDKNQMLNLFQADMTNFKFKQNIDLLILLFDSINYLNSKEEILNLFACVKKSLQKSSLFIFDISTIYNSREHFDNFINLEENNQTFFVHRADHLAYKKKQMNRLNIFSKAFLGYRREDETHQQKVWRANELVELIKKANLKLTGIYDSTQLRNLIKDNINLIDNNSPRLFFIIKNEE